jgi:hypothetical protein
MFFTFDALSERVDPTGGRVTLEGSASWTSKYQNGYVVVLKGPLLASLVLVPVATPGPAVANQPQSLSWRMDHLSFDALSCEKSVLIETVVGPSGSQDARFGGPDAALPGTPVTGMTNGSAPSREDDDPTPVPVKIEHAWVPGDPCNAFGIPQATMRCLEVCVDAVPRPDTKPQLRLMQFEQQLAESVDGMSMLIEHSVLTKMGPRETLSAFGEAIRRTGQPPNIGVNGQIAPGQPGLSNPAFNPAMFTMTPPVSHAGVTIPPGTQLPRDPQPHPTLGTSVPPASPTKASRNAGTPAASQATPTLANARTPGTTTPTATTGPSAAGTAASAPTSNKRKATADVSAAANGGNTSEPPAKKATTRKRRQTGGG